MRYIKLYEEFVHDEIHDVMMSICEDVSFRESEVYPSTERVRVYETDVKVDFDPSQYEEYLDGWEIVCPDKMESFEVWRHSIVFLKGGVVGALLSWLGELYGGLQKIEIDDEVYYCKGNVPVFMYFREDQEEAVEYAYYYVDESIWSFLYVFLEKSDIIGLLRKWLSDTYGLSVLTPISSKLVE